jgi:hypothetical protein
VPGDLVGAEPTVAVEHTGDAELGLQPHDPAGVQRSGRARHRAHSPPFCT